VEDYNIDFQAQGMLSLQRVDLFWDNITGAVYQLTITHNPIKETPDSIVIRKFVITDTGRFGDYLINEATWCQKVSFLRKIL